MKMYSSTPTPRSHSLSLSNRIYNFQKKISLLRDRGKKERILCTLYTNVPVRTYRTKPTNSTLTLHKEDKQTYQTKPNLTKGNNTKKAHKNIYYVNLLQFFFC